MRAVSDSVLFRKRLKTHLFMVALCNRADHYIFILFLSSFFFFSSLYLLLTFVDYCLLLMTLVLHLCSACNRRTINFYIMMTMMKSSAVAEMGDCGHNRHGSKRGGGGYCAPFTAAGTPCSTMWPGPRSTSVPSGVFIHPAIWPK